MGKIILKLVAGFFGWSPLYLVPAVAITLLVRLFARKYNRLSNWEYGIIFLPYVVWFAAMSMNVMGKSLSNLVEAFIIGVFYGVSQIARAFYPKKAILFSLIIPVLFAILVYIFTPLLPE